MQSKRKRYRQLYRQIFSPWCLTIVKDITIGKYINITLTIPYTVSAAGEDWTRSSIAMHCTLSVCKPDLGAYPVLGINRKEKRT